MTTTPNKHADTNRHRLDKSFCTKAEAVQLLQELSLASEEAFDLVKKLPNLIPALSAIAHPSTGLLGRLRGRIGRSLGAVGGVAGRDRVDAARHAEALVAEAAVAGASKVRGYVWMCVWCRSALIWFALFCFVLYGAVVVASRKKRRVLCLPVAHEYEVRNSKCIR